MTRAFRGWRWLALGVAGFVILPWYALADSVLGIAWLRNWTGKDSAPAFLQIALHDKWWLAPTALALIVAGYALRRRHATLLLWSAATGLAYFFAQGFVTTPAMQPGMGAGAALVGAALAMLLGCGLAARGWFKGDAFVACSVVGVTALVALFTFYPVAKILVQALQDTAGAFAPAALLDRLSSPRIWGVGCLAGGTRCGVVWNTVILATLCAALCTLLGLAFALLVARSRMRGKRALRALSILPIITPPFVIGLGLILLFGRSGLVNQFLEWAFGIEPSRWIYGMQGILVAQVFAFTPIAFLVLIGVVEGVSPTLEEAAQTLRADRWRTFVDVSLPLMRPGIANAFLISFIESIADFGNPILLGGNFGVLSTEIFFSVVGAQLDQGRAAALGIVLLVLALVAFFVQRRVLAGRLYTAVAGKGDAGLPIELPPNVSRACYAVAMPWALMTIVLYAMALAGGFVENWGRDYTPTLKHYVKAFGIEWGPHGILWAGAAWGSFWTTLRLSAIAAPLTAILGILTAYLLTRQRFAGQTAFEFGTMLSVRDSRHGDRRVVHPRVQCAADRDHRNGDDPRRVQRVPQHAGRSARRHGVDGADRQEPRRGVGHARRSAGSLRCGAC
jgi:iron(III) transport system permease protein